MDFEWDDAKAKANLSHHGVDFLDAMLVFDDPHRLEWHDDRADYGEDRFCTVGFIEGRAVFVAYTMRGETVRLISARRATRLERDKYYGNH